MQDPFNQMSQEDFMQALQPENWKEEYQRLHTATFDIFLLPDGKLVVVFADGSRNTVQFERNEVEDLTRFLTNYAKVEPLPAPDDSFLKDWQPTRVDLPEQPEE